MSFAVTSSFPLSERPSSGPHQQEDSHSEGPRLRSHHGRAHPRPRSWQSQYRGKTSETLGSLTTNHSLFLTPSSPPDDSLIRSQRLTPLGYISQGHLLIVFGWVQSEEALSGDQKAEGERGWAFLPAPPCFRVTVTIGPCLCDDSSCTLTYSPWFQHLLGSGYYFFPYPSGH